MSGRKMEYAVLHKVNDIDPFAYGNPSMEIINKKHREIAVRTNKDNVAFMSIVDERQIRFSATATKDFSMLLGSYLHFINDGDDWLFYVNKDPDGFKITPCNKNYSALVCSKSLVNLFLKRTRCSKPIRFPLTLTKMEKGSSPVIKIEINKPIN